MTEAFDPDAPYGRKPDGTPYKVPLETRVALGERLAAGRAAKNATRAPGVGWGPPPVTRAGGSKSTPKVSSNVTTVMGLAAIPVMLLGVAARFNPTFALDSIAVRLHAQPIAVAVDQAAQESDRIQAFLDAAGKATPGLAILGAASGLIAQIAANHGAIQPVPEMGILGPMDLLRAGGVNVAPEQPAAAEPAAGSADVSAF